MRRLIPLAIVPALLAACQPAATGPGAGGAVPLGDYQLLRMGGQDVESSHVTMLLDGNRISGRGFCNNYNAAQAAELPSLQIGPVASTMMACPGDRMARDGTYLAALEASTAARFSGGLLTLTGSGPELVFEPHVPEAAQTGG